MKLFEKLSDWRHKYEDACELSKNDKLMKTAFREIIQAEENDRESQFNEFNLKSTDNFLSVVQIIDIPEEFQLKGQQWQIMDKLNEMSYFVGKYLRENLKLEDNVSLPEYYHIEDPSSGTPFSCRYMAVWSYKPALEDKKIIYQGNAAIASVSVGAIGTILGIILLL